MVYEDFVNFFEFSRIVQALKKATRVEFPMSRVEERVAKLKGLRQRIAVHSLIKIVTCHACPNIASWSFCIGCMLMLD